MQVIIDLFNLLFLAPIVNLLVFIIRLLEASNIPGALGIAIIVLTVIIRLIVWPFTAAQLNSAKKMADLKPHLDKLKTKHGKDKQALAMAQMELYKEHGVNPAGGCLPSIIQIPVIIALYQAILVMFEGAQGLERINNLLYIPGWRITSAPDPTFLGVNLAAKPSEFATFGLYLILIPIITALLQFFQSKMMMPQPIKAYPSDSPKEKKEKQDTDEAIVAVQGQMIYLIPAMVGYFAFTLPVGLAIYWNTFTLLSIWQQYLVSGWGGLQPLVSRFKR